MAINRTKLTEIIESEHGNNWWKPELFELNVRSLLPEELRIVACPPVYEQNYNCFVYAFGLQNDPEFLGGNNPVQQEFVKWLILNKVLIHTDKMVPGNLIFYQNNNSEITHGGIMQDTQTVISKWMWGPIIIHKPFDVPTSFGDKISFFASPGAEDIKRQYIAYKNTGVDIKPIG